MQLYRCAAKCCSPEPGAAGSGRHRFFTVDVHCHALSVEVEKLVASHPRRLAEPQLMVRTLGEGSAAHNANVMLPAVMPKLLDMEARLADMDAMGVDIQVVSPSPNQYYYWAEEALAKDIVLTQNEHIAAMCAQHPKRICGFGTVALQFPELAAQQLRHAVERLGLKGVEISTSIEGMELGDAGLNVFWAEASRLGCSVFIHPLGTSAFERLNRWYLTNVIGQPLETTIALSHIILSGVLDRHPALRILAAHGGGYLPFYLGRLEHAWSVRPDVRTTEQPPSEYLKRIWFDSIVYEPGALKRLVDVVGINQVVIGTDYPFDMGSYGVDRLIRSVPQFGDVDRAAVLGGNAKALLRL